MDYNYKHKESNFGEPISGEVKGGTHISCECVLVYDGKFVALRRPEAIPEHQLPPRAVEVLGDYLYFVHGLPRWGETTDQYVERITRDQSGVGVKDYRVVDLEMEVQESSGQWAWTPYLVVELDSLPVPGTHGNKVTEVVTFTKDDIPDDLGWWTKGEFTEFVDEYV